MQRFPSQSFAPRRCLFLGILLVGSLGWLPLVSGQPGFGPFGPTNAFADVNNIFPLAPRELRQRLSRAQAALEEERYSDAVAEIGEVLNSAGSDDFFLGVPGSADAQISLKTEALALLGAMPAKGRKMYELQYGSDAKAALEAALNASDLTQLIEVSRRYFQTKAGYEATLLLGRFQLDQGRPLAAALTLKRVADVPIALAQYDPELSVLLATSWLHANQPSQARETLLALKKRLPQAKVRLVDREIRLFDRDTAALDWLQDIVGGSRSALSAAATQWVIYRGDEKRNAQSSGGMPLLNVSWKQLTVNDPADEQRILKTYRERRDNNEPLICALQPLVVQDYVIVRQPETDKLIGINIKNGKRIWVYPSGDETAQAAAARQAVQLNRGPLANNREKELRQRIWEDHAFGQVSSDGRQVYVIDELSIAQTSDLNIVPVGVGRGGMRFQNPSAAKPNLLMTLDLAKQGSQVWAVGNAGDNPALAGATFLGAPLPAGDQLYALAEFPGEIRLLCLDARTGSLEWKQPLANIENGSVGSDPLRRLAGASPSLADGILVCPTSAGAVVAVDLSTRTLRWGYQYPRADGLQFQQGGFRRGPMTTVNPPSGGSWLDATVTISDGSVILTPPESKQLHCLDLLTGKARWAPIPRDEMLFVACVHKGKIILAGKNKLKAINLADGKPGWTEDLKLDGEVVVGRGYYSEPFYFLPTSGQQICKIDLEKGTIVGQTQTEVELGNLVCYQDQLISVSPQCVASFVLLSEHLQQQLQERLAANPQDIDALALKAQILLQTGDADDSLTLLRRAAELAPDRLMIRSLLVKVMLALVRQDVSKHAALTDELDKLVTDPAQRREILRWRVQGLAESNRPSEALAALLELADQELTAAATASPTTTLEPVDRQRSVRMDRWLQGQLQKLVKQADSDLRGHIDAELKLRLERVLAVGSVHQLRMFLNLFGFHEASDSARLMLIDKLIAADALVEAEVIAGDLLAREQPAHRAAAQASLFAIYEKAKRPELAARLVQELASEAPSVVLRGGQTVSELTRQARQNVALQPYFADWPRGAVEVKESDSSGFSQRMPFPLPISHYFGAAPRGMKLSYDSSGGNAVAVKSDTGQIILTATLRKDNFTGRPYFSGANTLSASVNGHLAIIHLGGEVAAVDGLRPDRGAEALLWRQDAGDDQTNANPLTPSSLGVSRSTRNPLVGNRYVSFDSSGKRSFTGPVASGGVCFQRGRQIICVDPLTGASLWERSHTPQAEIPQQAELFGDDELLFVADARLDSKSEEVLVLSAIDGSVLGKRKIDPTERRWANHGRRVLAWENKNSTVILRLYDVWNDKRELWSRQLAPGSRGFLIDGEELAVLEPAGQFTVLSLETGRVGFSVPLEAESSLAWIEVIRSQGQYLLLASQEGGSPGQGERQPLQIAGGSQQRGLHGHVYAFQRATGKLQWQTPAFVAHHWLPPDQPDESPLLFFVAGRNASSRRTTAVLALDRQTGRIVYENELHGIAMNCDLVADPAKQTMTLWLIGENNKSISFQFTDRPQPPAPPAQTGDMASSAASRQPGVAVKGLGAALDLFGRGPPGILLPSPAPPNRRALPATR